MSTSKVYEAGVWRYYRDENGKYRVDILGQSNLGLYGHMAYAQDECQRDAERLVPGTKLEWQLQLPEGPTSSPDHIVAYLAPDTPDGRRYTVDARTVQLAASGLNEAPQMKEDL